MTWPCGHIDIPSGLEAYLSHYGNCDEQCKFLAWLIREDMYWRPSVQFNVTRRKSDQLFAIIESEKENVSEAVIMESCEITNLIFVLKE